MKLILDIKPNNFKMVRIDDGIRLDYKEHQALDHAVHPDNYRTRMIYLKPPTPWKGSYEYNQMIIKEIESRLKFNINMDIGFYIAIRETDERVDAFGPFLGRAAADTYIEKFCNDFKSYRVPLTDIYGINPNIFLIELIQSLEYD